LILPPASDNPQFMRPMIVNRFPTPGIEQQKETFAILLLFRRTGQMINLLREVRKYLETVLQER